MKDCKIEGRDKILYEEFYGAELLKMKFPEFWEKAVLEKNRFFRYVFSEAKQLVEKTGVSEEYLQGARAAELWERKCGFCFEEITTDRKGEFYCTKDCFSWICARCFKDFYERFRWRAEEIGDIPKKGVTAVGGAGVDGN